MEYPYVVMSDLHFHDWTAFASLNSDGVNTRLQWILDEIKRAAGELKDRGGNTIKIAGDIFHVRGSISPTVLNPVIKTFSQLSDEGFEIIAIPGNHDLASKDTSELTNAAQALFPAGVSMINDPAGACVGNTVFIPWHSSNDGLRTAIADWVTRLNGAHAEKSLIIHAPMNGIIQGIPDHGFNPAELKAFGFKYVFSGHYHDHKEPVPGVFSIGSLTHQTFSDIGTRAGFLIVSENGVEYRASHAPSFVEVTPLTDPVDLVSMVDRNYVRAKMPIQDESEVAKIRSELEALGAAGVIVHPIREAKVVARSEVITKTGTINESVHEYIKQSVGSGDLEKAVFAECSDIMTAVGVV